MADLLRCAIRITDEYFASSINGEKIVCPKKGNQETYKFLALEVCTMLDSYLELTQNKSIQLVNGKKPTVNGKTVRQNLGIKQPTNLNAEESLTEEHKYLIRLYRDWYGFGEVPVRTWLSHNKEIKMNFTRLFSTWGKFMSCALNPNILADYKPTNPKYASELKQKKQKGTKK